MAAQVSVQTPQARANRFGQLSTVSTPTNVVSLANLASYPWTTAITSTPPHSPSQVGSLSFSFLDCVRMPLFV